MITGAQLRAARALLNLTRDELAEAAKISTVTIKNIEHGTFRPLERTAEILTRIFALRDVVFTEDQGVKFSKGTITTFTGRQGYIQFLDDIMHTMRNGGKTRQFNFSDEIIVRYGGKHLHEYVKRMNAIVNLDAQCLVPEGDENFPVKHCVYRWLRKAHKNSIPYFLYANKIAMLTSAPAEEMVWVSIHSETLATAYLAQFDLYWQQSAAIPRVAKLATE